jgi:hypothetical protein
MNFVRCALPVCMLMVSISIIGCKSKQDQSGAGSGKPGSSAANTKDKVAAPAASPQEKEEARAAATKYLAQFTAGDFAGLYKNATPGFKQIGTESQFVEKFQQTRQKVGALKNPKEISFETRPNKSHVLVYRLENDHYVTDMRLTFIRSKSGKMELDGLNQHDELKK